MYIFSCGFFVLFCLLLFLFGAPQVPVADAGIAISCLKDEGRLVICGDHLQLAPIMRTDYPAGQSA